MDFAVLTHLIVLIVGIFMGHFLSRKQDDRTISILTPKPPKEIQDEMFRCMHTPEELQEYKDQRITTDGR